MRTAKKIFLLWLGILISGFLLLQILPHWDYDSITVANQALTILVAIVSFYVFKNEPNPKNKPIFLNFAILFTNAFLFFLYLFIGKAFFTNFPFARVYFYQYVTGGAFFFLLAVAILYVVIDTLFNELKTLTKYGITLLIVGSVFTYYYHPFFENPKYLYTTEDILDYKAVSTAVDKLQTAGVSDPSPEQIASVANLATWKDGERVGTLYDHQKVKRVAELLPYLDGNNYIVLITIPLHLNVIYINVLCVVFIFLFFGYQYKNDPPQGAYIEKIVFLFLPYCSLEIVHFFGYIKSVEYAAYLDYFRIGQYVSVFNIFMLLVFFSLRLRFIMSVKGEFYERELVSDSEHISRWRDGFDNLVVRHFLNPKTLHGRLFAPRTSRETT